MGPSKSQKQPAKAQVDFEEARSIFDDPQFITFLDDELGIVK